MPLPTPKPRDNLPVERDRIWQDVMALAAITDPDAPYTRRSFTARFLEGRDWLAARFEAAGLATRIDEAGNLIGRLAGTDPEAPVIMIGSHCDTVPSGGRFDGIAGVAAGLEVVRSLRDQGIALRCTIEIVDFLAEEPSDYGLSCIGSRGMSGRLETHMLDAKGPHNETLAGAIDRVGGHVDRLAAAQRNDIAAYLELHIEQGAVLESAGVPLGVVSAIVGIVRLEIVFSGAADHAGTTPMERRRDALVAAAEVIGLVRAEAERTSGALGYFVATVGIVNCEPNAANVVPGRARLVIDARAEDRGMLDRFAAFLDATTDRIAREGGLVRERFAQLSRSEPSVCDPRLRAMLADSARAMEFRTLDIASGAGHDAAFLATIAPMAMVFIPSRDGRSHCPEEWSEPDDLAAGAAVLLQTVQKVDAAF